MKKLLVIALALIAFQANAQEQNKDSRKGREHKMMQLEPEEMAELQTKKMTLHLDLTEAQQSKIMALNLEQAKERKAFMEQRKAAKEEGKTPTKEDRLKFEYKKLDAQIAHKKKMKSILNEEQYKKWETMKEKRAHKRGRLKSKMRHGKRMEEKKMESEMSKD